MADDRWENRSVLTNLLEPIGFEMILATNGQEGIEKAIASHPDLIITDISMSLLDGYELMTRLRSSDDEKLKNVPIVVSSASVFEVDRYKSFEAGANEFVPKPVQAEVLLDALKKQLGLTWQYETAETAPEETDTNEPWEVVLPPEESFNKLYDLSRRGLVPMLIKEAETILAEHPECEGFVKPLVKFAKGFQLKDRKSVV